MTSALATTPAETHPRPVSRHHIAFCKAVAAGSTQSDAYRKFVSRGGTDPQEARVSACKLAGRYRQYIHTLRARILDKLDHGSIMSKAEAVQFVTRLVRTPIADIDEHSDLAQEVTETTSPDGITRKTVKMGRKLDGVSVLGKLLGWESPTQVNHTHILGDSPALRALETAATRSTARTQSDASQAVYEAELIPDDPANKIPSNSYGISRQSEEQEQGQEQGEECIPSSALDAAQPEPPPDLWDDPPADQDRH